MLKDYLPEIHQAIRSGKPHQLEVVTLYPLRRPNDSEVIAEQIFAQVESVYHFVTPKGIGSLVINLSSGHKLRIAADQKLFIDGHEAGTPTDDNHTTEAGER